MARSKITYKWDLKAFQSLRRSQPVNRMLAEEVKSILSEVGGEDAGYAGDVGVGKTRSRGYVVTTNIEALLDNRKNHTLLRALGRGGR